MGDQKLTHPYELAIYAPMIYTAPCVMFLMRAEADPLRGQVGGGRALEIERVFLGLWRRHTQHV